MLALLRRCANSATAARNSDRLWYRSFTTERASFGLNVPRIGTRRSVPVVPETTSRDVFRSTKHLSGLDRDLFSECQTTPLGGPRPSTQTPVAKKALRRAVVAAMDLAMRRSALGVLLALSASIVSVGTAGCLEPPGVGRAADPARAPGPAPWGSATSNADLEKKRHLLDDVLDGKITAEKLVARVNLDWPDLTAEQRKRALVGVTQVLEDLTKSGRAGQKVEAGPDRDMAIAQLYFSERRFIEAATMLSTILDAKPTYPGARNLLARCFFFLGNRDRTLDELTYVLESPVHQKDQSEMLDALFLMGAAVAETPGMSRENLKKGQGAWETYLKIAPPDSPMVEHVQKGLLDIEAGLRGEGHLAQPLVPVQSGSMGQSASSKDALGGARNDGPPMGSAAGNGSAPSAQAAQERRADKLPATATAAERLTAEGWDALDIKDLPTAEEKLKAAIAEAPQNAEALTGLGRVYVQTGRRDEALRSFGEALKVAPDFMPAWHYNGMAQLLDGSPQQAVLSWEKIREKDPAYFAQFNLGQRVEVAKRMAQ